MRIDLNADLGEDFGDDDAIFPCISSANVASGAYSGGDSTLDRALANAAHYGVTVGAHVGYADPGNFGRLSMVIDGRALAASLQDQISRVQDHAQRFGLHVSYVKPHGALYHATARNDDHAGALIAAVNACDPGLELLVADSAMLRRLAADIPCRQEFFADRGYLPSGQLVPRGNAGDHIEAPTDMVARTMHWLQTGEVTAIDGSSTPIHAESICLHGDSPISVAAAVAIRAALVQSGYRIVNWMAP